MSRVRTNIYREHVRGHYRRVNGCYRWIEAYYRRPKSR